MNTSGNNYDSLEQLIFSKGIKIKSIDFDINNEQMKVVLNTRKVLTISMTSFKAFRHAQMPELIRYQIINEGTGVHWPLLDEDLSLKGFLQEYLLHSVAA